MNIKCEVQRLTNPQLAALIVTRWSYIVGHENRIPVQEVAANGQPDNLVALMQVLVDDEFSATDILLLLECIDDELKKRSKVLHSMTMNLYGPKQKGFLAGQDDDLVALLKRVQSDLCNTGATSKGAKKAVKTLVKLLEKE